jgi:hypothetical protein
MLELLEPLWLLAALMLALVVILGCAALIVFTMGEMYKWVKDKYWGLRCWYDRQKKTDQR